MYVGGMVGGPWVCCRKYQYPFSSSSCLPDFCAPVYIIFAIFIFFKCWLFFVIPTFVFGIHNAEHWCYNTNPLLRVENIVSHIIESSRNLHKFRIIGTSYTDKQPIKKGKYWENIIREPKIYSVAGRELTKQRVVWDVISDVYRG